MRFIILAVLFVTSPLVLAGPVVVAQKNKAFVIDGKVVSEVAVTVGDTVRFLNEDEFFHNVFSLSDLKMFDLGSFPQGEHRDVVFDSVGTVEVECAIHPDMMIKVNVK